MSTETPLVESSRGYLSEASKRRFTIVAGVLGAVFFLAQFLLPILVVFLIMFPGFMLHEFNSAHLDQAVVWNGDVWYTEDVHKLDVRNPKPDAATTRLRHMTLSGLAVAEDVVVLPRSAAFSHAALLPQGDRLWMLDEGEVSYYESGQLTTLSGGARLRHASRPFLYEGLPTVVTWGRSQTITQLVANGGVAEWRAKPFALDLPLSDGGSVERVDGVRVGERLYLVAELRDQDSEQQELYYREMGSAVWQTAVSDLDCCRWDALAYRDRLAIVLSKSIPNGPPQFSIATPGEGGGEARQVIGEVGGRLAWGGWRSLPSATGIVLLSEGMPGSRRLVEIVDGKIVRRVEVKGGFPFGGNMMAMMLVPQLLPLALSLALALILTYQMRRHRVGEFSAGGTTRVFASLWQRAMAQVVDAIALGAGMVVAFIWMARAFSDPERMIEEAGPMFPLRFFGLFALGFVWMIAVLVLFSYFEGRWGKTPGKWLLRIRVLGTDLRPCGFGRAVVRNLLTFVDGFFNFLVGILLVALTEHWQRLGDLAARTLVFVDERGSAGT